MFFPLRFIIILVVLVSFIACKSAVNSNVPGARANTAGNGYVGRPGDPAKITGDVPDYDVLSADLKYLQTLEPPVARFDFGTAIVDMPAGAKDIIAVHWKDAVKYYYDDYFNKPKDANDLLNRQQAWSKYCAGTDKKLQEYSVRAPAGSRAITPDEARGIHNFLNQAAGGVIDKAKAANNSR